MIKKHSVKIEVCYDGWSVYVGNKRYHWEHNEEDFGTGALKTLFEDMGYDVTLEEVC